MEIGIDGHFKDEVFPYCPVGSDGGGSTRTDAGLDTFLRKAEVTAKMICGEVVQG